MKTPKTEDLDLAIRDVGLVRIERMNDDHLWVEITGNDGSTTTLHLVAAGSVLSHQMWRWPEPAAETPTTDAPSLGSGAESASGHRPAGGPSVEEDASRGSARVSGGRP